MSPNTLQNTLLRPPILHILRAAGFQATRPAAVDTLVDIASRYLCLLASHTSTHASINHNDLIPTVTDVRMALEDVGALRPQIGAMEEQCSGEEDTRGMNAFLKWMMGEENKQIRRIAELLGTEGEVDIEAGVEKEDYLTSNSSRACL
jgi:transcription initiation factor TFIID subunit 3